MCIYLQLSKNQIFHSSGFEGLSALSGWKVFDSNSISDQWWCHAFFEDVRLRGWRIGKEAVWGSQAVTNKLVCLAPDLSFSFLFSRQLIRLAMGNFLTTGKAFRQNAFDSYDIVQNERWPQTCFHPPTGSLAMSTRQCANINFSINFSISFLLCLIVPNQCLGGVNSVECLNPMTKHSCRFSRTFGALSTSKWHLGDTQDICACFKLKKSFRNLSQLFASNLSFSFNYPFHFSFFAKHQEYVYIFNI